MRVRPVVVAPGVVVRQPIIAGRAPFRSHSRIGFGSIPVRTGFGTLPVRTGFETVRVGTGLGIRAGIASGSVISGRRHALRSKGFRAFKRPHVVGGGIVVGYPVYPYVYPQYYGTATSTPGYYGFATPVPGYYVPPLEYPSEVSRAVGVSAGPSTYWTDLANRPGASSGLSFEVAPANAEVYVDAVYVGTVRDFVPGREPLLVVPGSHHIELRAPGYRTVTFVVTVVAGQVIPYEGELEPLRP